MGIEQFYSQKEFPFHIKPFEEDHNGELTVSTIDLREKIPHEAAQFLINTFTAFWDGKPLTIHVADVYPHEINPENINEHFHQITSYLVPEQFIHGMKTLEQAIHQVQVGKISEPDVNLDLPELQDLNPVLALLQVKQLAEQNEGQDANKLLDNILDAIPKWNLVSYRTGRDEIILLSPETEGCSGLFLTDLLSGKDTNTFFDYLDSAVTYCPIDPEIKRKMVGYYLSLFWNLPHIPENINLVNLKGSYKASGRSQLIEGIEQIEFNTKRHLEFLSKYPTTKASMEQKFGSTEPDIVPLTILGQRYGQTPIYIYYLGYSPRMVSYSYDLVKEGIRVLKKQLPEVTFGDHKLRIFVIKSLAKGVPGMQLTEAVDKYGFMLLNLHEISVKDAQVVRHELVHRLMIDHYEALLGHKYFDEGLAHFFGTYQGQFNYEGIETDLQEVMDQADSVKHGHVDGHFEYQTGVLFIQFLMETKGRDYIFGLYHELSKYLAVKDSDIFRPIQILDHKVILGKILQTEHQAFLAYLRRRSDRLLSNIIPESFGMVGSGYLKEIREIARDTLLLELSGPNTSIDEFEGHLLSSIEEEDRKLFGEQTEGVIARTLLCLKIFDPYPATFDTEDYATVVTDTLKKVHLEKIDLDMINRLLLIAREKCIIDVDNQGRFYIMPEIKAKLEAIKNGNE